MAAERRTIFGRRTAPLGHWPLLLRVLVSALLAGATIFMTFELRLADLGCRFLLAYPAVLAASYLGGRFAGYTATLGCGLLFAGLQHRVWTGSVKDWAELGTLALFTGIGLGAATLLSRLKSANRDAALANVELERSRDEARAAHQQTDLLLRELRHRVKNDIANAASLLRLQAKSSDGPVRAQLDTAAARLLVLARVHEQLSRHGHKPVVDLAAFLDSLCSDLRATTFTGRAITLEGSFAPLQVSSSEAVAVGLILNELITNSVKYGFADNGGSIRASVQCLPDRVVEAVVSDDGSGFDAQPGKGGLGHQLVRSLAAQLRGEFACESSGSGTTCRVRYPGSAQDAPSARA